jgi:hypothetical protein
MSNVTETPKWEVGIYQIETTDPVLGGETGPANVQAKQLANRTSWLKQRTEQIEKAINSNWLYRNQHIAFEFFVDGYRLRNTAPVQVTSGTIGSNFINVVDTSSFRVGQDYLLIEGSNVTMVRVAAIPSSTQLQLASALTRNYSNAAILTGETFTPRAEGGVNAPVGSQWISRAINLGDDGNMRMVIIRRTYDNTNDANVRLYYRDSITSNWTERLWNVRRVGMPDAINGIPDGYADYEYPVPMQGEGFLRIVVENADTIISHIVALDNPNTLGGEYNPAAAPNAPTISNPANGATNVGETPTVSITGYSSPIGNAFGAAQFQIATNNTFSASAIVWDSGWVNNQSTTVPAGILQANTTTYYLRARVRDTANLTSAWSATSSFTTKASFAYVNTPSITSPTNGQTDIPEQPTIYSSAFAVTGGSDTHAASQWQIRLASGTWSSPVHDSGETTTAKTQYTVPAGVLQAGQTQYVLRVRHKGASLGWSEWSSDVTITTKQNFANIIGLVQIATGGGAGTYQRIDENFNAVTRDAAWFNTHPTYAGIVTQVIDGQYMVKIPKFYFKADTVPSGTYAGKAYWMISDQPTSGFTVHPAFLGAGGVELDQIWVGKYQASYDGSSKAQSIAGVMPMVNMDFPTARARAYARNTGGVSGFRLWSIYDLSAIQMLATIEMGGLDMQSLIGQGHVNSGSIDSVDATNVAQATWRGIVGLWGNIWQMVDGIKRSGGNWHRWQYNVPGNTTTNDFSTGYIDTNQSTIVTSGYPVTFNTNLLTNTSIIVPATVDSAASNGSTGDYFNSDTHTDTRIWYHGGHHPDGSNAGLFYDNVVNAPSDAYGHVGTRLAKV